MKLVAVRRLQTPQANRAPREVTRSATPVRHHGSFGRRLGPNLKHVTVGIGLHREKSQNVELQLVVSKNTVACAMGVQLAKRYRPCDRGFDSQHARTDMPADLPEKLARRV